MAYNSKVGNVVQTVTNTYQSFAAYTNVSTSSQTTLTQLTTSITPKFSNSKVLILASITYDWNRDNSGCGFIVYRDNQGGTDAELAKGNALSNNYRVYTDLGANANADQSCMQRTINLVDSPASTNQIQYQIRLQNSSNGGGRNFILNASQHANGNDGNQGDDPKCVSVVTLMELAQ